MGKGKIQTFTDLFGLIQTLLGALLGKRSGTGPRSGKVDPIGKTALPDDWQHSQMAGNMDKG